MSSDEGGQGARPLLIGLYQTFIYCAQKVFYDIIQGKAGCSRYTAQIKNNTLKDIWQMIKHF